MYRSYFELTDSPFSTDPNPRFFYLAPSHADSVAKCEYAIRNKSGLAVVYGDVGTGKTTILNELRQRFEDSEYTIAVLNNPIQTSDTALLKAIAGEFGLKPPRTKQGAFDQLQEFWGGPHCQDTKTSLVKVRFGCPFASDRSTALSGCLPVSSSERSGELLTGRQPSSLRLPPG